MRLGDRIYSVSVSDVLNDDGDTIEDSILMPLGDSKCIITPNNSASLQNGEDGDSYSTAYVVFMKKPSAIPQEGELVHIVKEDGSIDKECYVRGFVTLKRWLKLWLQ